MFLDNYYNLKYTNTKEEYEEMSKNEPDFLNISDHFTLDEIGECTVFVTKYGGITPHFELKSLDGNFYTCIEIFSPKYFNPPNNINDFVIQKLNTLQSNQLNNFLHSYRNGFNLPVIARIWLGWCNLNTGKIFDHYDEGYNDLIDYSILEE